MARVKGAILFLILLVVAPVGALPRPAAAAPLAAAPPAADPAAGAVQAVCAPPAGPARERAGDPKRASAPAARRLSEQGGAASSATYSALLAPRRMIPGEVTAVAVTVTNTTGRPWPSAEFLLSYRWKLADSTGHPRPSDRTVAPLPADLQPDQSVTLSVDLKAPTRADVGNQRESFVLEWDMFNRRTRRPLSESDGVPPLRQDVTVEHPTSNQLGLEKFYQYRGENAGAGWTAMVNQFSGNAVVGYDAMSSPSRGVATFVRLTYNSLDGSDSYLGQGWSLATSSLNRLGSPLQFHRGLSDRPGYPGRITLVDGDGTSHLFELNKHDSHDPAKWTYDNPAGVHVQLRRAGGKDRSRTWVMTRPDRTELFFDDDGHQSVVVDKNGNELRLHYQHTRWGNRNTGVLTHITDATGRRALTLDYYQRGDELHFFSGRTKRSSRNLTNTSIMDQLRSITDITGRKITFAYSDRGQLREVIDGADTPGQKVFGFFYDDAKLVRINDPLGNGTQLRYQRDGRAHELVDRRGQATTFDYADADGKDGSAISSKVTDGNGHAMTVFLDGFGRPVKMTNARAEITELAWDEDNNLRLLKENNGAITAWVYDRKTGYPLEIKDAEANAGNTPGTRLTYRTGLDGHIADLVEKTSPEGRRWTFTYDERGNLTAVTDPKGSATPAPADFTTTYSYDQFGQLLAVTDANGHTTRYDEYDPTGYPRRAIDALGCTTTVAFDASGNVVAVTDARQKTSTFTYDIFKRPLSSRVPKDATAGQYIVTPGPRYDQNDNVLSHTAANDAVTTARYDAADRLVAITAPKDDPKDPEKTSTFTYDAVGSLLTETQPKGTLSTDDDHDFVTRYSYDELNRLTASVDADGNRMSYTYDGVGNLVTAVDPRRNATPDPSDVTTRYAYDLNHRVTRATDAAGFSTGREYDRDNNVVATVDQDGNRTIVELDGRGAVREVKVPHRRDGDAIVYRTTRYEYDAVGNRTRVVTPRGVETADDPDDFVVEIVYDELNRIKERRLPFDRDDERVKTADSIFYGYDEVGSLVQVSAPPSAGQSTRNVTRNTYFDNGWTRTSTDAWNITTSFGYDVLGNQTSRTVAAAGGSATRTMSWEYYPDGKIKSRADDGVPVGKDVLLVDNSDQAAQPTGEWGTAGSGEDHEGFDYRTHNAGTGSDTFTWNLDVPRDGTYEVFVRYAATATATDAAYTVEHEGGSASRTVDQTQQAGQWVSLGSFRYAEDQVRRIVLSDNANGTVVADAVKLVRDSGSDPDAEQKSLHYVYDANDNLTRTTDSSSNAPVDEYVIGYAGLNQVAAVQEKLNGTVRNTTRYTYDANGNLHTLAHDAQNATYEYDTRDLIAKVASTDTTPGAKPQVTSFTYTSREQKATETKANGNTVSYDYHLDQLAQRYAERKADGTLVSEHTLDYDANGQRTRDTSRTMNADNHGAYLEQVHTYTYDPRDRARRVVKSDPGGRELSTESYAHDANNNVVEQTLEGKTTAFTYDRNRQVRSTAGQTTTVSSYDPFGRLDKVTSAGTLVEKYRYDGFDRVAEHQKLKAGSATERVTTRYTYDPLDRTTTRTENPGGSAKQTRFTYLGLSSEVVTEELAGRLVKSYRYSPDGQRLSQTKHNSDGTTEDVQYGYTPNSDVETVTDERGNSKATYGYTAYGNNDEKAFTGVDKPDAQDPAKEAYNPYRFNAKRFDSATGDYDMGFRDYDPGRNSFLSRDNYNGALNDLDLATDPWTGNRYAFAGGNPVTRVEIDGHEPCPSGQNCNYLYTGESRYAPTPEIKAIREQQEREARWLEEYNKAIDDLPDKYQARTVLSDPVLSQTMGGEIVGNLVDRRFCERVGNEECAAAFEFLAGTIFVASVGSIGIKNLDKAEESGKIVRDATNRQLSGGWNNIVTKHLTPEEMQAYQNDLKAGKYGAARRWLGTALHRAVAADLDQNFRGRFAYNASRGPDFRDRQTGQRVELTTVRQYGPHLARGGLYPRSVYVLYRPAGTLPPGGAINRGGGR